MFYIFMDLEYNTIDFKNSRFKVSRHTGKILKNELMQVEIQIINDNKKLINSVSEYIRPVFTEKVSDIVYNITKISTKRLSRAKVNTVAMCRQLNELFSSINGDAVLITWGNDDERVLRENFEACGVKWNINFKWIDLQIVFANKYNYYDKFNKIRTASLIEAGIVCGIPFSLDAMHNAKWDVKLLMDIANKIGYDFILSNCEKRKQIKKVTITQNDDMIIFNPYKDPYNIVRYTDLIENTEVIKIEEGYKDVVYNLIINKTLCDKLISEIELCKDMNII